jgi:glyoxylase-like metal-dependent hydrolase (beta-lactamase superfamily II)
MSKVLALVAAVVFLLPAVGEAQDGSGILANASKALGASVRSIQYSGNGVVHAVGQNAEPGAQWPRFTLKSFTRTIDYEAATQRDEIVRSQLDPVRGGGGQPVRGEQRQNLFASGNWAWNVVGDNAVPVPVAVAERQLQIWTTPHGLVKAAMANKATGQGRTFSFTIPNRLRVTALLDAANLIQAVDAVIAHPVLGDMPISVWYSNYKDFGGVKFPTRIRQTAAGLPSLDLTVTDVRPNVAVDVTVPDPVRRAVLPYALVASEEVADGVWYLTGGSHHSVVIEMKDHVIVVESPLNDQRALAVISETRKLVPNKPIRYVINTHHHFDHSGGLRGFASIGVPVITHEVNRAFLEAALAAPTTISPDMLATSGRKATVEGFVGRRVLADETRTVEIHHMADNPHHDGLVLVYLPKDRILIEADAFNPLPPNASYPTPPNPASVHLADMIARHRMIVDTLLPLHGRKVTLTELHKAIGRTP